jgi:hypothetical protein
MTEGLGTSYLERYFLIIPMYTLSHRRVFADFAEPLVRFNSMRNSQGHVRLRVGDLIAYNVSFFFHGPAMWCSFCVCITESLGHRPQLSKPLMPRR